jgi:phage tail-like protein
MGLLQSISNVENPESDEIQPLTDVEEIPVPIYQFCIEIEGKVVALFQSFNGMSVSRDVEGYNQGGQNDYGMEFPGQVSYDHVTFEAGLSSSDFFWKWMMHGRQHGTARTINFDLVQRRPYRAGDSGPIYDEVKRWNFFNAFPVSWSISDLNVDETESIVVESLELSFDYFEPQGFSS